MYLICVKRLVDKLMLFLAFIILQMKRVRICYIKHTLCLILITALPYGIIVVPNQLLNWKN